MPDVAAKCDVLEQFVERANALYSLPAVAMEVLELTSQPRVDVHALKECIERDPALTGRILRVVNSAMFGLSREVSDLNQALALLGVKPLKLLVLGFSLPKGLFDAVEAETLERYWRFTLVKSVAARELSHAFWSAQGDESFIAGLLQDIGFLVLIQELGDSFTNFVNSVIVQQGALLAQEAETLGFNHAQLSAHLLDHWALPNAIVRATALPHDIEHLAGLDAEEQTIPQVLHLATLIAAIIVDGRHSAMNELLEAATRYRDVTVEQIDGLLDQIQERVGVMSNVFSVRVDKQVPYREILAQAQRQMADATVDAMPDMFGSGSPPGESDERHELTQALERFQLAPNDTSGEEEEPDAEEDQSGGIGRLARVHTPDPGLLGRLMTAAATCRIERHELSLILVEIDNFDQLLLLLSPDKMCDIMTLMTRVIEAFCEQDGECLLASDARYAIVMPDCDRQQAVSLAKSLIDKIPVWLREQSASKAPVSCSAGIATLATPGRSTSPQELLEVAERCLFAAQASGTRVVKSIDIL